MEQVTGSGGPDPLQSIALSKPRRQAALGFIFATALMDITSMSIMIPVLPNLVKSMVATPGWTDAQAVAHAAVWTGLFASTWGALQLICSPIQGMMSDRFGRRPVLLISIFGLGVDYLFMAFAPTLWLLYIGRIINGITAASFSTAGAYIADITPPEKRAQRFGLMGAAFSIGFIIGPGLGGKLADIDLRLPFLVSAAMAGANWLYGVFVLPESLPPERRAARFEWKRANPFGSLKLLGRHKDLLGMAGVLALFQLAHNVFPAIYILYVGHRYGWSAGNAGLAMMLVGACNAVVQFLLVGPLVKRFGERRTLLIGFLAGIAGLIIYGAAPNGMVFLIGVPVMALFGLIQPGLQSLMSRRVEPWEQGQLQGANSASMGVMTTIGPQLFTRVLEWSVLTGGALIAGVPMYVAAAIMALAFVMAVFLARPQPDPA